MLTSRSNEPELLFSVAGVARMMNVTKEAVRDAVRQKRLRTEMILIGGSVGISIPLSAVAECWNLPNERVQAIKDNAGQGVLNAPVSILTALASRRSGHGQVNLPQSSTLGYESGSDAASCSGEPSLPAPRAA